ncbi:MAG: AAA family ATPase [Candidatus Marinimicrobia bacterium]|nr:AAA family ATPase [Candidatus Neomarinimicrobiota bacterium]
MSNLSLSVEDSFKQAILDVGIVPPDEIIADGEIHRWHIPEDKSGSEDGWYVLYSDLIPAGSFGDWKQEIRHTWSAKNGAQLSRAERDSLAKNMRLAKLKRAEDRKRRQSEARELANIIWDNAEPAADTFPYLLSKGVKSYSLRSDGKSLIAALRDSGGVLWSLQFISEDGAKKFLFGGKTRACYCSIGKIIKKIYIVEGFATGATVHSITKEAVAVAFSAGNLKAVAKSLREKYPDVTIIIVGDNDVKSEGNPGRSKAFVAAAAVGGLVILPVFEADDGGTDFNDLLSEEGPEVVRKQLSSPIRSRIKNSSATLNTDITSPFVLESGFALLSREFNQSEPLVGEILGANKKIVVAAPDGVGKSLFTHQMGIVLAVGADDFLGFHIPRPRRVLLLNFEMSAEQIQERHIKFCSILTPAQKKRLANFHFNTIDSGTTLFSDNWQRIRATIVENPPFDLIIIDNLYAASGSDDESNRELKPLLREIFAIADIHKSTILLVTHDKKHEPDAMISKHLIRGGSTIANSMDAILQLAMSLKSPGLRLLKITKNRDRSPNLGKTFGLEMDPDTLWFRNQGLVDEAAHLQYPRPPKGIDVLTKMEEKFSTKDWIQAVAEQAGSSRRTAYNWIDKLTKAGLIQMKGWGGYEKLR